MCKHSWYLSRLSAKMCYVKHILWEVERVFGAFGGKSNIIFDVNLEISNFIDIN